MQPSPTTARITTLQRRWIRLAAKATRRLRSRPLFPRTRGREWFRRCRTADGFHTAESQNPTGRLVRGRFGNTTDCDRDYAGPFGLGGGGVFLRHATVPRSSHHPRDFNTDMLCKVAASACAASSRASSLLVTSRQRMSCSRIGDVPRTDNMVAAAVQWADKILRKIDNLCAGK